MDTPRRPSGDRGGFLFVLSSVTEVPQKFWALFPAFGLPTEGFEVKSTPRGPRFGLFWAEMLSESVSGTARALCCAWQLALRRPASDTPLPGHGAVFRFFRGATRAGRHRLGGTGRHRRGDTRARTLRPAKASPPIRPRWPGTDRQAGPGKTARSARDFGESRAHRAHSGGKNSEKNSKKFFERF